VSAERRTARNERRRRFGQNFLRPDIAEGIVAAATFQPGELVPGNGGLTVALARRGVRLVAVELDPRWVSTLRRDLRPKGLTDGPVVTADFRRFTLPRQPFGVIGSLPFGSTTSDLRHRLDDSQSSLLRAAAYHEFVRRQWPTQ
jgi:23S rRNA (adenine-N6)-dimethyltransferase